MSEPFSMPELNIGDMVLFYFDPFNPREPLMGWVSKRPGSSTISILVWADDAGLVEKPSVRHVDDPFWRESETAGAWTRWGAFKEHPNTALLHQVSDLARQLKLMTARSTKPKDAA